MKKFFAYLMLTTLFVTSCSQTEETTPQEPSKPSQTKSSVSFRAEINPVSRATDIEFEVGDKISVFASKTNGISDDNYAENVEYTFDGSLFNTTDYLSYPDKTSPLAFYAIYPYNIYSAPVFDFKVKTDQSTHKSYTESDLMTSSNRGNNEKIVNLDFYHRLSKVIINLNKENLPVGTPSLKFKNVYCEAEGDLASNTFNAVTGASRYDIIASSNGANSFKAILPPQVINAGSVFVEITIGSKVYTWTIDDDIILNSGVEYSYTLYFDDEAVKFTSYINPWNTPSEIESIIPQEYIDILKPHITIYDGITPPNVEGVFLCSPNLLYYDSKGNFSYNDKFADDYIQFYNQATNNTLNMMSTQNLGDLSVADGVFISGNGNNFSVYFNEYTSYDDGSWLVSATIISATKDGNKLKNYKKAFIILNDYDPNDQFMDVGDYRVLYDGDYSSESVVWPLSETRSSTTVEGISRFAK